MPIDVSKRKGVIVFLDSHTVNAADVALGQIFLRYEFPECLLTNFCVNDRNQAVDVDVIVSRKGGSFQERINLSIALMQLETTYGAMYDVIWEGERYIPPNYELNVVISQVTGTLFTVGDTIWIHGGYDVCAQL